MKVFIAQINVTVGDFAGNQAKILTALKAAKSSGADLVVYPELAVTGYPPEDLLFRKSFIDKNLDTLQKLAKEVRGICAIVGFVDRARDGQLYNAAAVLQNGRIAHVYHKTQLPNYGVFDEKRYFSAGYKDCIFKLKGFRIGVTICEDIWQEDAYVYKKAFKGKADLLVNISASPYHSNKQHYREKLVSRLATKTGAHVLYVNLVGGQDELVFDGGSLIADPKRGVVARASRFAEGWFSFAMDKMEGVLPAFESEPALEIEEEIYRALVLGTRDYVRKNGFKKVLIGLSGGIDSALVARIAVDTLGASSVLGVTMPSPFTSKATLRDAKQLAHNLHIDCLEIPIHSVFKMYRKSLAGVFKGQKWNITEENLQARIRGNILMALSNKFGHLVLTTGNKSEFATGYCTLYGDMAGGFAVIKDVPKTLVFRLAHHRNLKDTKPSIPLSTLRRAPSAELRANQKDQDSLPPYPILDRFLEAYIEHDEPLSEITKRGIKPSIAHRAAQMVDRNEYKRRQAPPGVKITPRAFGRDRRMPLTSRCEL